ncbi:MULTISPECIES: ABC transporter permease [Streptomyces]|uniref:Putative ABC transporter membrane protein n=1 Tax=Streptomyces venezuelae (strain ATCC 10712 / CBS 650.69 / DSM 40230 / JCM 4526 / NBRC 13096 / PD 04745) TaxID=953739 RepID=F2RAK3_STRVP|nr:ABC transporter membrane protein [Streptomyces venezuelae]APE22497.1 ABC transporter permease [Streptomyces venezuelae]QER99879.1 ABC transporter permease [Streptomyces venezuelae ATCC 10712]CCA56685.1 putative ABC transporter membrane protein [Streptomyces venezuelae ATCC 10712]
MSAVLAGTGTLTRLALRRDRLVIPVWALVTGGLVASGVGSLEGLYGTAAERAEVAASMTANSSMRALYGPVFDDSLGGLVAWRFGTFAAVLAAVASLIVVVRHTREEEETGRQEMLSAGAVGRRAPLTAALLAALTVNAAVALIVTAGLAGQGAAGALALGLAIGGTGMVFATTAALAAQLTESARLAKGLTGGAVGLAFVLRAAGDSGSADGSSVLTWLSPIGWAENVRAFAGERWWVLLLIAAAVLVQTAAAYALTGRRDVGASFLATRPGPAEGGLATAGALAWRLQRGTLLGWSLGFLLGGLVFGGMVEGAADIVGDNEQARQIFERMGGQSALTDAFLATMVSLFGMVAALFAVGSVLRPHGEETSGRAEPLLANALGRVRWATGHLVIAFGGSALILLLAGLGLALSYGHDAGPVLGASLAQLPAVWTLAGLAVLLWGAAPKAATAAWGAAGLCLALGWVGPALELPQAALNLSPFGHLPKLPGPEMSWTPVVALTVLAAALVTAGLAGLRRRDMLS